MRSSVDSRPLIVLLHALGGNAASWNEVIARLDGFECLAIDLPGFGAAADDSRVTVEQMANVVTNAIQAHAPSSWLMVGHSMGGKIATVVAAHAEHGREPAGLVGVVLLAASPPSPEPMDEDRRDEMISWVAKGSIDDDHARQFVTENSAKTLPPSLFDGAVAAVRSANPDAWRAWLVRGSREDWSRDVGHLAVPAVIAAGSEDGDLAAPAQRRLNVPHYKNATVSVIAGAAHLLPLEAPEKVAALIRDHATRVAVAGGFAD